MAKFETLTSRTVVLSEENIDTDQIIPARFLTTTTRAGLGQQAFYDWRYNTDGTPRQDAALNQVDAETHQILVAGRNFGCGSSREHAPWALTDFGFQVVISSEIADIFHSNALKNGLVPIVLEEEAHQWLLGHPDTDVTVNLDERTVRFSNHEYEFSVDPFARVCLMEGVDQLGFLQSQLDHIESFEAAHP